MLLSQMLAVVAGHAKHTAQAFMPPAGITTKPVPRSEYKHGIVEVGVPGKIRRRLGRR